MSSQQHHQYQPFPTSSPRPRSNNRLMYLLDRLDRLRFAVSMEDAEDAMHEFTHGLLDMKILKGGLQLTTSIPSSSPLRTTGTTTSASSSAGNNNDANVLFNKADEIMLQDLHEHAGAIPTLLHTFRQCMGIASPEFFNSACIALIHFAFQNKERSRYIYRNGGLTLIMNLMQCYRSVDYIQIIGIALMMIIGKNVGMNLFLLEYPILYQIILAMEYHCESSKVFTVACSALGTLFGPGSSFVVWRREDDENDLYHRTLGAICYGLVLHLDDSIAIDTGMALLRNMVGPSMAEELVNDAEREHGGPHVAAAAA